MVSVSITNIYEPPLTVRDIVVTSVLVFKWTNTQLHKYTKYKYTVRLIHIIQIEDPMLQVLGFLIQCCKCLVFCGCIQLLRTLPLIVRISIKTWMMKSINVCMQGNC